MTPFSANPDYLPRPQSNALETRDSITLDDLPTFVKAILSSPALDSTLAEIAIEEQHGTVRAGIFRQDDGTRMVTVIVVTAESRRQESIVLGERFGLTPREVQVALLLARRLSAKEIARELGFSRFAASRHTEQIMFKLGVKSRRDVAPLLENLGRHAA